MCALAPSEYPPCRKKAESITTKIIPSLFRFSEMPKNIISSLARIRWFFETLDFCSDSRKEGSRGTSSFGQKRRLWHMSRRVPINFRIEKNSAESTNQTPNPKIYGFQAVWTQQTNSSKLGFKPMIFRVWGSGSLLEPRSPISWLCHTLCRWFCAFGEDNALAVWANF